MCLQSITTGVGHTFAAAAFPLTGVLLLPQTDMLSVDMVHEAVHIALFRLGAVSPETSGDLGGVAFRIIRAGLGADVC